MGHGALPALHKASAKSRPSGYSHPYTSMVFGARLSDWRSPSRTGRAGLELARWGSYMSLVGAPVATVYIALHDQAPWLLVAVLSIGPGIVVTATGLVLLARNGTYGGADRWRWWNWVMWRY